MRVRAERTAETRQRILDVAYVELNARPYDEVTLQVIADGAGVAVQTVLRHFGTKEGLIVAGIPEWTTNEHARRAATPGDTADVARVLAELYEALSPSTARFVALEGRIDVVAEGLARVRQDHLDWLAEMFAGELKGLSSATRQRRLAQLFGATEIAVWTAWRNSLGLSARQAERTMADMLDALVAAWHTAETGAPR